MHAHGSAWRVIPHFDRRLRELGVTNFTMLEARHKVGGLAASETSPNGFIYDIGGHVLFSHYPWIGERVSTPPIDRVLGNVILDRREC